MRPQARTSEQANCHIHAAEYGSAVGHTSRQMYGRMRGVLRLGDSGTVGPNSSELFEEVSDFLANDFRLFCEFLVRRQHPEIPLSR